MNDLTMAPLPAKTKQERDVAGEKTVYRCGVLSCPEILAVQRPDFWQNRIAIWPQYQHRKGIYAASKRSGARDFETRQNRKGERARIESGSQEMHSSNRLRLRPDQIAAMDGLDADRLAEIKRPEMRYVTLLELDMGATVKCAQCGRLSKIKPVENARGEVPQR